jgi:hypothetical protein
VQLGGAQVRPGRRLALVVSPDATMNAKRSSRPAPRSISSISPRSAPDAMPIGHAAARRRTQPSAPG